MSAKKLFAVVSRSDEAAGTLAARLEKARHDLAVIEEALALVRGERDARLDLGDETSEERAKLVSLGAERVALAEEVETLEFRHAAAVSKAGKEREEARKAELRAEAAALVEKIRSIREELLPGLDAVTLAVEADARAVGRLRLIADALPGEAVPRLSTVDELSGPVALSFRLRELAADLRRYRV